MGGSSVHADLWAVSSIADIVGVLTRAYARVSGVFRVRRFLADLLGSVGFSVNLGRTQSVSYQGSAAAEEERVALRALLGVRAACRLYEIPQLYAVCLHCVVRSLGAWPPSGLESGCAPILFTMSDIYFGEDPF